ncbi:hypothetical protein GCM10025734_45930 [Kitasatospora paranensis]|uniref:TenA family protein n=1 Tax=Kitasatospora paranensis TaxID=258053 RepID=UPI0031EACA95
MSLTDELWAAIEPVYDEILAHPFLAGLTDGTLPRQAFRHFVVQDSHYLRDYARALAVCAAKAPGEAEVRAFADDAVGAIAAEQGMHAEFLTAFGDTAEQAAAEPVMPTTRAYTSYLLATVYGGSFAEAVAAVLPCYWIYARVGERLLAASSPSRCTRSGSPPTATSSSRPWCGASSTSPTGSGRRSPRRTPADGRALHHHLEVRVDVLGRRLARRDLAGLIPARRGPGTPGGGRALVRPAPVSRW